MASELARQVASCNRRSREKGLAGTLTTLDWERSLDFFDQRCAYCSSSHSSSHAWTIDHFQPLMYGGGSTYSNVIPACHSCNEAKASSLIHELPLSFIDPEQLKMIETYLEEIGKRNQEHWQRLSEREPVFARMDVAVARLKTYCEKRMMESSEEGNDYAILRLMLFGVEWDPEHYFQVEISLLWQQRHSLATMMDACNDARRVLHGEEKAVSTT